MGGSFQVSPKLNEYEEYLLSPYTVTHDVVHQFRVFCIWNDLQIIVFIQLLLLFYYQGFLSFTSFKQEFSRFPGTGIPSFHPSVLVCFWHFVAKFSKI